MVVVPTITVDGFTKAKSLIRAESLPMLLKGRVNGLW